MISDHLKCRPNRIHRYHQIDSAKASITMSCINLKKCISISHKQKTQANVWRRVKFVPVKVEFFWGLKDLGILRSRSPPKYGIYDPISILIYIWDLNWSKSIEIDLNRSRSWKDLRSAKHWLGTRYLFEITCTWKIIFKDECFL